MPLDDNSSVPTVFLINMILGILITILIELLLPIVTGLAVALSLGEIRSKLDLLTQSFVYGQIIIYALFQPVFVFAILKDYRFSKAAMLFGALLAVVVIALIALTLIRYRKDLLKTLKTKFSSPGMWGIAALVVLGILIVMSFIKAYYDGDDSYYVAAAAEGVNSDSMYKKEPYTGDPILSPYRYLFAPFPMWIAFISKLSGIKVAAVAHSFMPWCMILLTASVMYMLSGYLFKEDGKKRGLFMFLTLILIMFGDYSIHTPENFLLARSRQGKAALASFILPFMFFLIYGIIREFNDRKKVHPVRLLMVFLTGLAGSLGSTLGGVLCVSLVLTGSLCMLLTYRKFKYPFLMAVCSVPCLIFPVLYFVMR